MKNTYLLPIFEQLERAAVNAKNEFGSLNEAQLNWKPNPKTWSIGQCIHHLIMTNKMYYPIFEAFATGNRKSNIFERMGLFSGYFGKMLLSMTAPHPSKKVKTVPSFEPSQSTISLSVLGEFMDSQHKLIQLMKDMDSIDHSSTLMSSPASNVLTYSIKDACTILGNHGERHFNQAKRLLDLDSFPKQA